MYYNARVSNYIESLWSLLHHPFCSLLTRWRLNRETHLTKNSLSLSLSLNKNATRTTHDQRSLSWKNQNADSSSFRNFTPPGQNTFDPFFSPFLCRRVLSRQSSSSYREVGRLVEAQIYTAADTKHTHTHVHSNSNSTVKIEIKLREIGTRVSTHSRWYWPKPDEASSSDHARVIKSIKPTMRGAFKP